ncbi:hypothetical protein T440DRAFT_140416 [Plenodomus tracheiphilus IPT5]|uniref:Uncharacterized protein n=1 Tax=Plenodomus tracheiphilus IPT5 TaxID=1408161 RepID=A0A6A7B450_9PLEO|nr:hypothetical protein T440DRAFT_140416 [Plenodomus tracheiphilus IPT5]
MVSKQVVKLLANHVALQHLLCVRAVVHCLYTGHVCTMRGRAEKRTVIMVASRLSTCPIPWIIYRALWTPMPYLHTIHSPFTSYITLSQPKGKLLLCRTRG